MLSMFSSIHSLWTAFFGQQYLGSIYALITGGFSLLQSSPFQDLDPAGPCLGPGSSTGPSPRVLPFKLQLFLLYHPHLH